MLRTAVIGLGWWGRHIVGRAADATDIVIAAASDIAPAAAAYAAERGLSFSHDYDEILGRRDIDAVILATPHSRHEAQAIAALQAGKHVFCEKPVAMTVAGVRRMLALCEKNSSVLGVGHERRYEPAMRQVRDLVTSGKLGRILFLDANVSHDNLARMPVDGHWRFDGKEAPAGLWTGVCIHLTDLFVSLCGAVGQVHADAAAVAFQPPMQDFVRATLTFLNGAQATVTAVSATPFYGRFTVFGTQGWVEVVESGNVDKGLASHSIHCNAQGVVTREVFPAINTVAANLSAWARVLQGRGTYPFTPAEIIENTRIFEMVVRSIAERPLPAPVPASA